MMRPEELIDLGILLIRVTGAINGVILIGLIMWRQAERGPR
jgi:hypothetical protein